MPSEERAALEARRQELEDELEELEARRENVAEELAETREALEGAREARETGEGSTAELSNAQTRVTALSDVEDDLSNKITRTRSRLRKVRSRLRREQKLDSLADKAREGAELFEQWEAARRELAEALEELPARIVGIEDRLEQLASRIAAQLEALDASRGELESRGVELSPLSGYKEPGRNLVRHWGHGDPLDYRGTKPERSDLGGVDELVASVVDEAREEGRSAAPPPPSSRTVERSSAGGL